MILNTPSAVDNGHEVGIFLAKKVDSYGFTYRRHWEEFSLASEKNK